MRWIPLAGLLVTPACTGTSASKETATRTAEDSGGSPSTTTEPTPKGRIHGTVVDESAAPWTDATVNLCREIFKNAYQLGRSLEYSSRRGLHI